MEALEEERKARGLTQAQLAAKVGLTDRAYCGYVCGERPMPIPFQNFIAKSLRSPRLAAEVLAQLEDNPFAPVILDVDEHPAMEICEALEELREALEAVASIDPSKPDLPKIERAIDQLTDLQHLIPIAKSSWRGSTDSTSGLLSSGMSANSGLEVT